MNKLTIVLFALVAVTVAQPITDDAEPRFLLGKFKKTTVKPSTATQTTETPITEQPATEQPATEQPATEQSATEQPTTEQPATDEPASAEPTTESSANVPPQPPLTEVERPVLGVIVDRLAEAVRLTLKEEHDKLNKAVKSVHKAGSKGLKAGLDVAQSGLDIFLVIPKLGKNLLVSRTPSSQDPNCG